MTQKDPRKFITTSIRIGRDGGSSMFCDVSDEASIDCGDYSDDRLATFQWEVSRKIAAAWGYMRDRCLQPQEVEA